MTKIKQVLRICGLTILILLACSGIAVMGGLPFAHREQYMDNEIKIELVEKRKDEDESDDESEKT